MLACDEDGLPVFDRLRYPAAQGQDDQIGRCVGARRSLRAADEVTNCIGAPTLLAK